MKKKKELITLGLVTPKPNAKTKKKRATIDRKKRQNAIMGIEDLKDLPKTLSYDEVTKELEVVSEV